MGLGEPSRDCRDLTEEMGARREENNTLSKSNDVELCEKPQVLEFSGESKTPGDQKSVSQGVGKEEDGRRCGKG